MIVKFDHFPQVGVNIMLMFVYCILDSEVVPKLGICSCSWFSCPNLITSLRCFFKRFEGIVVKLRCLSRMSRTLCQTYTWRWWNGKISYTSNDHKVLKPSSYGWAQWILENLLRLFENLSTIFPNHKKNSFAHLNESPALSFLSRQGPSLVIKSYNFFHPGKNIKLLNRMSIPQYNFFEKKGTFQW